MTDFEKILKSKLKERLQNMEYTVACPNCNNSISAISGNNICPYCNAEIRLNLDDLNN